MILESKMPKGTFDWKYAILIYEDEKHEYWYDPINLTGHKVQKAK
jgi:hypothetical protein